MHLGLAQRGRFQNEFAMIANAYETENPCRTLGLSVKVRSSRKPLTRSASIMKSTIVLRCLAAGLGQLREDLRCARPDCYFLVYQDTESGGLCCRHCHNSLRVDGTKLAQGHNLTCTCLSQKEHQVGSSAQFDIYLPVTERAPSWLKCTI